MTLRHKKAGGIWKVYSPDSPASMSPLEESTAYAVGPMMGVFNNLVLFDQRVKQTSLQSIVPDLATSWSWSVDGTKLTFQLRQGGKWHDGEPLMEPRARRLMGPPSERCRRHVRCGQEPWMPVALAGSLIILDC